MNPDSYVLMALLAFGLAAILFFAEILVPSAGLLGIIAAACTVAGIVLMFMVDQTYGIISMIIVLILTPILFMSALRIWPHTPIGRMLTLSTAQRPQVAAHAGPENVAEEDPRKALVGQEGRALHDLRPVGTCVIGGERHDCLAARGLIEAGSTVRVVAVDGIEIKVEAVDQG